jgi:hypothetical protein
MTKKGKLLLGIVAAALVVVSILMIIELRHEYSSDVNAVITVQDGIADPNTLQTALTVSETGTYQVHADWWMDEMPGFLTGLIVSDESGNTVFSTTGAKLLEDSAPMELQSGKYLFRFELLPTLDSYRTYMTENFPGEEIGEIDENIFRNGTWEMRYEISIGECADGVNLVLLVGVIVLTMLIVAFAVVAFKKEDAPAKDYDERQIAAQGMGYRYGFFTMIAYYMVLMVCNTFEFDFHVETNILIFLGIILGAGVTVTTMIVKDAYFKLNENQKGWTIYFVLFALANLILGGLRILSGGAVVDGVLTFTGSANFLCGVLLTYLSIVILAKTVKDRKEE